MTVILQDWEHAVPRKELLENHRPSLTPGQDTPDTFYVYRWNEPGDPQMSLELLNDNEMFFTHDPLFWLADHLDGQQLYRMELKVEGHVWVHSLERFEFYCDQLTSALRKARLLFAIWYTPADPKYAEEAQGVVAHPCKTVRSVEYLGTAI